MCVGYVCIGLLAAFGLICALWAAAGWLLPGSRGSVTVCLCRPGLRELHMVRRACWLREVGLTHGPVLIVDCGLTTRERQVLCKMGRGIEFCSLEELGTRLEQERKRLD